MLKLALRLSFSHLEDLNLFPILLNCGWLWNRQELKEKTGKQNYKPDTDEDGVLDVDYCGGFRGCPIGASLMPKPDATASITDDQSIVVNTKCVLPDHSSRDRMVGRRYQAKIRRSRLE